MKKKIILTTVILILTFWTGCGKTANNQIQHSTNEKGAEEQLVEEHSENIEPEVQQPESQQSESQQEENAKTDFGFENVSDKVFYFSSGAGAWYTELFINSDGTFWGNFHDSDMGDDGDAYPNGTLYYCDFTGMFDDLEKIDEFTYKMKLASIEFEQEPNKEEIIDGIRYIYSTAYGLDDGEDFYLYLPDAKLTELPEDYLHWIGYYDLENTTETTLPFYGLYNVNTGDGFSSYDYKKQSLSERIAIEIFYAEERNAKLEAKLQDEDIAQSDMNTISEELFQTWDDTLNVVWKLLVSELDDATMKTLRTAERNWITFKEAEIKAAGQAYEGGSMQLMAESMKASELTKQRVYELAEYAK